MVLLLVEKTDGASSGGEDRWCYFWWRKQMVLLMVGKTDGATSGGEDRTCPSLGCPLLILIYQVICCPFIFVNCLLALPHPKDDNASVHRMQLCAVSHKQSKVQQETTKSAIEQAIFDGGKYLLLVHSLIT